VFEEENTFRILVVKLLGKRPPGTQRRICMEEGSGSGSFPVRNVDIGSVQPTGLYYQTNCSRTTMWSRTTFMKPAHKTFHIFILLQSERCI
jgi:hypothetical protein